MRRLWAGAALAAALAAAGCGGGAGGGSVPEGASIAPASAIAFVSVKTDFSSAQWRQVAKLAGRFPGTPQLIAELKKQTNGLDFNRDVKPALGPEVDLVWIDARNGGNDVVGLTKPDTKEKLTALLEKSRTKGEPKAFTVQVGDWVAIADSQAKLDRFRTASAGGKLADDKDFKRAFEQLESDSSVRAWISGELVQSAIDGGLVSGGAPPRLTHDIGDLLALSGSAKAEDNGASIELDGLIDPTPDPATFSPSLQDDVPAGALLYVSTTSLEAPLKTILRLIGESRPKFNTQLSQSTRARRRFRGFCSSRRSTTSRRRPRCCAGSARSLSSAAASRPRPCSSRGRASRSSPSPVPPSRSPTASRRGRCLSPTRPTSPNRRSRGRQAASGTTRSSAPRATRPGCPERLPRSPSGDLENGLPYVLGLARQAGNAIPPEAFANTKPLHGAVAYLVKDGDALRISGFQTIK